MKQLEIPVKVCRDCKAVLVPVEVRSNLLKPTEVHLKCPICKAEWIEPTEPEAA